MRIFTRAAVIGVSAWLVLGTSLAGVVIQYETKKSADAGGAPGSILLAADRLRLEQDGTLAIFRADKQVLWLIDQKARRYTEMSKEQMKQVGSQLSDAMAQMQQELKGLPPEQRAQIEAMLKASAPQAGGKKAEPLKYVKNGKSETINDFPCAGYDGRRGETRESEVWVTDWKRFGLTAADFKALEQLGAFMKDAIGPLAERFSSAFAQPYSDTEGPDALPGVPIRVISLGGGGRSIMEIKKVSKEDLPAQRFEVPEGLRKEELGAEIKTKTRTSDD